MSDGQTSTFALPAGRYRLEVYQVPELNAIVSLERDCYVITAVPILGTAGRSGLSVVGGPKDNAGADKIGVLMVVAVPYLEDEEPAPTTAYRGEVG